MTLPSPHDQAVVDACRRVDVTLATLAAVRQELDEAGGTVAALRDPSRIPPGLARVLSDASRRVTFCATVHEIALDELSALGRTLDTTVPVRVRSSHDLATERTTHQ